jgi:S-adenosylmethionine/arginine decarboxylase-like enzyme/predicted RNA methylase
MFGLLPYLKVSSSHCSRVFLRSFMNIQTLISDLKDKNKGLKKAEIQGLLAILVSNPQGLSMAELTGLTGVPRETLLSFKASISSYLDDKFEGFCLDPSYITSLKEFKLAEYPWSLLKIEDSSLETLISKLRENANLKPKRELDQFIATSKTSAAKAILAKIKGLADDSDIAFVGDDDFVSLAMENMELGDSSFTVFDIDPQLLEQIRSKSTKGIQTIQHDCRVPLPNLYKGHYDLVITDPPYTPNGVKLFLNRALELLGKADVNDNKYIILYYGNSFKTPEKTLKIQEIIGDMKLLIEDKIDKFARYSGADSMGNASSAYILRVTPFSHVIDVSDDVGVYTHENQKIEKFPYVDHYTFKLYGVDQKLLRSRANLLKALNRFCDMHKLHVVDRVITEFKGGGATITLVLSASNFTVHTWPEFGALHMDLITCSPIYNKDTFRVSINKIFESREAEIRRIE